jgi:hypothetical protein
MSDIFISYAKADHALALKLSAFLESEGWSVWWDKSLAAADPYRDEIMKQLAAARAVIAIWTENSVKSDWVRAEAGRAKADGKLIPVKTTEVAYADIPLPFGEMHTENIGSTELIRAAIVAQLAKPTAPPSPFWQITGVFKYQVLTWIGIIGSAITVYAGLSAVSDLGYWARQLVDHWHELTQMFWGWVFGWIGLKVPKQLVPAISFTLFAAMLVVGVNLSVRARKKLPTLQIERPMKNFVVGLLLFMVTYVVGALVTVTIYPKEIERPVIAVIIQFILLPLTFPMGYLLYVGKERVWVVIGSLLFLVMGGCLLIVPLNEFVGSGGDHSTIETVVIGFSCTMLFPILWMAVIIFSPLRQLTQRLVFVVVGVVTLVVLGEISKLNLHQYLQPPKASDNSLR